MSERDPFEASPSEIAAFVREQVLALVVSCAGSEVLTTPLPLLCDSDATGAVTSFLGHFALANPQVELVRRQPRALILFQGPHAYIRPGWVSRPRWAPTWNYMLAQFEVEISLMPEANDAAIRALVTALEGAAPDSWRVEQVGKRYPSMLRHVVAFRAAVSSSRGRFKLGQDETDESFREIVAALGDAPLAGMMRRRRKLPR
jgi:transcriptional regulator